MLFTIIDLATVVVEQQLVSGAGPQLRYPLLLPTRI
jgi:hypothetical protein